MKKILLSSVICIIGFWFLILSSVVSSELCRLFCVTQGASEAIHRGVIHPILLLAICFVVWVCLTMVVVRKYSAQRSTADTKVLGRDLSLAVVFSAVSIVILRFFNT